MNADAFRGTLRVGAVAVALLFGGAGCESEARVPASWYDGAVWSYQYMAKEREKVEALLISVCKKHRDVPGVRADCHGYADIAVAQRIYPPWHPECYDRACLVTGTAQPR